MAELVKQCLDLLIRQELHVFFWQVGDHVSDPLLAEDFGRPSLSNCRYVIDLELACYWLPLKQIDNDLPRTLNRYYEKDCFALTQQLEIKAIRLLDNVSCLRFEHHCLNSELLPSDFVNQKQKPFKRVVQTKALQHLDIVFIWL